MILKLIVDEKENQSPDIWPNYAWGLPDGSYVIRLNCAPDGPMKVASQELQLRSNEFSAAHEYQHVHELRQTGTSTHNHAGNEFGNIPTDLGLVMP